MEKTFRLAGTYEINLYTVNYEDKKNPSEKGLGYVAQVVAANKSDARKLFAIEEPDCEILSVECDGEVITPVFKMSDIGLNEYQLKAMTTCLPQSHNDAYMLTNLTGGVGELNSKIAKAIRKGIMQFGTDGNLTFTEEYRKEEHDNECSALMNGIVGELGDILWQLSGLVTTLQYDMEYIAKHNLEKLSARKAAGTIDGNGDGVTKEDGRE